MCSSTPSIMPRPARRIGDGDLLALDLVDFHRGRSSHRWSLFGFEVRGRFVSQQTAHFLGQFTETLGADVAFAHQADLVLDQGCLTSTTFIIISSNRRQKSRNHTTKATG